MMRLGPQLDSGEAWGEAMAAVRRRASGNAVRRRDPALAPLTSRSAACGRSCYRPASPPSAEFGLAQHGNTCSDLPTCEHRIRAFAYLAVSSSLRAHEPT